MVCRRVVVFVLAATIAVAGSAYLAVGSNSKPKRRSTSERPRPLDPALFTTGSCESFSPTRGGLRRTVFLDVGHGGLDPGRSE
jgi:N-acetylmuramoyl-L-alanine amidase